MVDTRKIKDRIEKDSTYACTSCFSNLGVGSRMKIYGFIKESGRASVSDIVSFVGLTQPTISYHLHEMEKSGLLKSIKEGKHVFFCISGTCPKFLGNCVLSDIKFPVNKNE
jgi:DNA-binding transcriptional ArsR family regulator